MVYERYRDENRLFFRLGVILLVLSILALCCSLTGLWYKSYLFNINCSGFLKRAADANTIPLAEKELQKAVLYIEDLGLTKGNTSFIFETPKNDLVFWYENLRSSLDELQKLDIENMTALEQSNVLMKLRETIIDDNQQGVSVTMPAGISVYPHRWLWLFMVLIPTVIIGVWVARFMINDL